MKTIKLLAIALLTVYSSFAYAQEVDEIIGTYIETIGGQDAWSKIESMKVTGIGRQQGVDYPFVATFMKDGRTVIDVDLQGTSFIVEAFDGEQAWSMNFQTQQPEAFASEASKNYKNDAKDNIPDALFNYKEKGYKAELLGTEQWEGTECYKIKLTKTPLTVDGKQEENAEIYYFDTDSNVPIAVESLVKTGPAKGMTSQTLISDYQEVNGVYVAFTTIDKFNGLTQMEMHIKTVEFNTEVDESIFKMPENKAVKKD